MVKILNEKILNALGTEKVPRVLVGNKTDLILERKVSKEEGQSVANEWGCGFAECSGKHNDNIDTIFQLLMQEIEKSEQSTPGQSQQPNCILL